MKKIIAVCLAAAITFGAVSTISASARMVKAGDADLNGKVNIVDATCIQMNIAGLSEFSDAQKMVSDVDNNGSVEITDVTLVQKISAEQIENNVELDVPEDPTEPATSEPVYTEDEIEQKGSKAMNDFSVKLLRGSVQDGRNTLVSPLSVLYALGMSENGANGNTLKEIENTTGMPRSLMKAYLMNYPDYKQYQEDSSTKFHIANSVWYNTSQNSAKVSDNYISSVRDNYDAEVFPTIFNQLALENINGWVNEKTDRMIPSILTDIDSNVLMYLINAISFEAVWDEPYVNEYISGKHRYSGDVSEGRFTNSDGNTSIVDFMSSDEYIYLKDDNAQGFVKQYEYGNYAFAAILPDKDVKLNDYVNSLTGDRLSNILNNMSRDSVTVVAELPKFQVEYSDDLSDNLKALGIKDAFGLKADFKGMLADKNAISPFISQVLHKTTISVTERGAKAAAVTAMVMYGATAVEERHYVYLDRPFLYMIINMKTNTPIFIGTIENLPDKIAE